MLLIHNDIPHMHVTKLENGSDSVWVNVFANQISHFVASWSTDRKLERFFKIEPEKFKCLHRDTNPSAHVLKKKECGHAESDLETTCEFNGRFTDVFTKTKPSPGLFLLNGKVPFMEYMIVVSKEGMTKFLKGLNSSKVLGADELHHSSYGIGI